MKSLTIRRRILLSFAAVLAVMSAIAALCYVWFLQTEREALAVETKTVPGLYYSAQLTTAWAEADGLSHEFHLSDTAAERSRVSDAILASRERMRSLLKSYEPTIDSEQDRKNHTEAQRLFEQFVPVEDAMIAAAKLAASNGQAIDQSATVKNEIEPRAARLRTALRTMMDFNKTEADESTRNIVRIVRAAEFGLIVAFIVALGLALLCGYLLFRAITVPLGKLLGMVEMMRRGDFSERLALSR